MKKVQFPGAGTAEADTYVGPENQVTVDTDRRELRLHDGVSSGGIRILGVDALDTRYRSSGEDPLGAGLPELGTGILARTGDAEYSLREIEVGPGLEIANSSGVGGNPGVTLVYASTTEVITGTEDEKVLNPASLASLITLLKKEIWSWCFDFPADGTYMMIVRSPYAATVKSLTSKATAGTATVQGFINATPLGGTSNAVSSTEVNQVHASANAIAAGDDFYLVFSSSASLARVTITAEIEKVIA